MSRSLTQNQQWPGARDATYVLPAVGKDATPELERCEAFTPAERNEEREERSFEQNYKYNNPITRWMAQSYRSREWEEKWLRDYMARQEEGCDRFRMQSAQPFTNANAHLSNYSTSALREEKAREAVKPKPGGAKWVLWNYEREVGDLPPTYSVVDPIADKRKS